MIDARSIAWLAGLLEGEGSFGLRKVRSTARSLIVPRIYLDLIIQLGMTDEDVVRRAAALFGGVWVRQFQDRRPNHKPQWQTSVVGSRAAGWMMTLYPLMGQRRQARIREVLGVWRQRPKWGERGTRAHAGRDPIPVGRGADGRFVSMSR